MKKTALKVRPLLIGCLLLNLTLTFPGSAFATTQWFWSHGHTAKVQAPWDTTGMFYMGWGLEFIENTGTGNWIHIAIPSPATVDNSLMRARYIKIRFYTGSADAWISDVHVWNGESLVKQFTGFNWSGDWQTQQLDLGSLINFDKGLGLSIFVRAGVESLNHKFIFSGAGARFE